MLKPSLISYKIKYHEKRLEEVSKLTGFEGSHTKISHAKEMGYHRFLIGCLERQEKVRIASLPWANAGQILHNEYKRDWTEAELKDREAL